MLLIRAQLRHLDKQWPINSNMQASNLALTEEQRTQVSQVCQVNQAE